MMAGKRYYPRLFLAVLAALGVLALSGPAKAVGPGEARVSGGDAGTTIAFVLALSGQVQGVVPVPASDIRAAASNQLALTLSQQGFSVIPQEDVLPLMREWRVRDAKSIPRGFLDALTDSLGTDMVLIANLIIQPGRVIMTGRYVNPVSAILLKVNMTEYVLDQHHGESSGRAGSDWLVGVQEASTIAGTASPEAVDSEKELALMLDTQPVGCSEAIAVMVSHAILEYYVKNGDWDVIDPAITASALQSAGHSTKYLGSEARAQLQKTFACSRLMIPEFISYHPATRTRRELDRYDDDGDLGEPIISDFAMNIRIIDLASGEITAGKEVFVAIPQAAGWFGIPIKDTLTTRLKVAAGRLWSEMHTDLKEY